MPEESRETVLVVEDQEQFRNRIVQVLEEAGCCVMTAFDFSEAVRKIVKLGEEKAADCIFYLDWGLPKGDMEGVFIDPDSFDADSECPTGGVMARILTGEIALKTENDPFAENIYFHVLPEKVCITTQRQAVRDHVKKRQEDYGEFEGISFVNKEDGMQGVLENEQLGVVEFLEKALSFFPSLDS